MKGQPVLLISISNTCVLYHVTIQESKTCTRAQQYDLILQLNFYIVDICKTIIIVPQLMQLLIVVQLVVGY